MRVDRERLRSLPDKQLSKVGHSETLMAGEAALQSLTRRSPQRAAPNDLSGTWYLVPPFRS
jgi:hypothetical protein